jgi:peptidoglycan-associated lipoprotein
MEDKVKKRMVWTLVLALILGLAVGASTGCSKKDVGAPGELSAEEQARLKAEEERRLREQRLREGQMSEGRGGTEAQMREIFSNQDIHYDYDRYDLSGEAKQILNDKAGYMQSHPEVNVIVEGHCDERGSASYNMALGEKRARAAAAYLQAMGVSAARMETVTYGKEKPLVQGHSEAAYAANRRAHFVIK